MFQTWHPANAITTQLEFGQQGIENGLMRLFLWHVFALFCLWLFLGSNKANAKPNANKSGKKDEETRTEKTRVEQNCTHNDPESEFVFRILQSDALSLQAAIKHRQESRDDLSSKTTTFRLAMAMADAVTFGAVPSLTSPSDGESDVDGAIHSLLLQWLLEAQLSARWGGDFSNLVPPVFLVCSKKVVGETWRSWDPMARQFRETKSSVLCDHILLYLDREGEKRLQALFLLFLLEFGASRVLVPGRRRSFFSEFVDFLRSNRFLTELDRSSVNDDFCDCLLDGRDETTTSACSGLGTQFQAAIGSSGGIGSRRTSPVW